MMTKVMSHFNSRLTTAMFLSIRERLINQKIFLATVAELVHSMTKPVFI